MNKAPAFFSILALMLFLAGGAIAQTVGPAVVHTVTTVNGLKVDRYAWADSAGHTRTVSLKQEGNGNPTHGGYAIQMTYVSAGQTIKANAEPGDGFGYFVSHERFRDFTDGANDTIAGHVFHTDDSPLGLGFKVTGTALNFSKPTIKAHRFTMSYPRYGTIAPIPKDANGNDVSKTPTDKSKLKLYHLPITITWFFQDGKDYPRIQFDVGFGDVPGPDRVNFDVRGPYGVLRFDNGTNHVVDRVIWGDRFHFQSLAPPLKRGSSWNWNQKNNGARYHALIAGVYEMGLFEPRKFPGALVDSFADERGLTSGTFRGGQGCEFENQLLPCDWEWPYQSAQYSLPENRTGTTTYKKIAWGSSAYYGTGPSLTETFDTGTTSEVFNGFPSSRKISYSICVVLGKTITGGLTRKAAVGPTYSCAGNP